MPERVNEQNIMIRVPLTVGAVMIAGAGTAAGDLLENHNVSVATVVAVCAVILPAAWWLSGKFTKIEDGQSRLEEGQQSAREHLASLDRKVDRLPCHSGKKCASDTTK